MNLNLSNWKLSHAGLALVMVPLLCQVVAVTVLLRQLDQAEAERKQEMHAKTVMLLSNNAARRLNFLSVSFITGLIPASSALKSGEGMIRREQISNIRRIMSDLKALPYADIKEKLLIERLAKLIEESAVCIDQTRSASLPDIAAIAHKARQLSIDINKTGEEITEYELKIESKAQSRHDSRLILFSMLGVNFVVAIVLALLFAKLVTQRLARISDNSMRLAEGAPLHPPLYGADEIARLDQVFHNMAIALAESSRKERAVTDNARDVICSLNADCKFIGVNPAAANAWGYSPASLTGLSIFDLLDGEDKSSMEKRISDLRDGKIDAITCETKIRRKDESKHHALWSISYSALDKSFFCVAHDITTRKELELLKEQFLSIVSHDLKSPLNSVLGTLELIIVGGCGDVSEQAIDKLRASKRSITRLTSLINNLLDIERLDSGEMPISKSKQALAPIIERSIEAVQGLADATMVEIDAEGTDVEVVVDAERMVQVFVNLLSNAIKCSAKNDTVSVSVAEVDGKVEIRIKDQGPGIPEEFHQVIFERYKQLNGASGENREGTGLGLAICKAIVEQHEGIILVESSAAEGSTFYVRMPMAESG